MSFSRLVIDTNVVFEGLTKEGGAAGLVIEAWQAGLLQVYVSNTLAIEYVDVLSRLLSLSRWSRTQKVLGYLLNQAHFTPIYFSWRPQSPDPADDHVIDCAMNAGAAIVTSNIRDFKTAHEALGVSIATPVELVNYLTQNV